MISSQDREKNHFAAVDLNLLLYKMGIIIPPFQSYCDREMS